jgi:type II secretory pathway pseudopilin PulG
MDNQPGVFLPDSRQSGFGLVEIVVSMFLLGLLALAFLPFLVQALQVSVMNTTLVTSTQLVSQQMQQLRAQASTCTAVTTFAGQPVPAVTDTRGITLEPHRSAGACPATYPGTIKVTAWVNQLGKPARLAEAVSLVYVRAAA